MASADSHSDRSRSTWVQTEQGELRPLSINECERLVGVKEGDTAAHNVSEASRRRMCGNAFQVGWIAHMLHKWINHTWTLPSLAARTLARTVCGSIASFTSQQVMPSTVSATFADPPRILDRIRVASNHDPEYERLLQSPPEGTHLDNGLFFEN